MQFGEDILDIYLLASIKEEYIYGTMQRLRATIFGEVQNVGYRAFVKQEADRRALLGYAKNMSDGSVEVLVEGEEDALLDFLDKLWEGPSEARINQVEDEWENPKGKLHSFQTLH